MRWEQKEGESLNVSEGRNRRMVDIYFSWLHQVDYHIHVIGARSAPVTVHLMTEYISAKWIFPNGERPLWKLRRSNGAHIWHHWSSVIQILVEELLGIVAPIDP